MDISRKRMLNKKTLKPVEDKNAKMRIPIVIPNEVTWDSKEY